ncbi:MULTISPECIES: RAMP superfamily CRISPR-associated protein [unclassified Picosynechococcus]|nr:MULTISPECIES: RAMP superfamily CRISPR-associated protein [unclassified Picosynechococcus]
MRPADHKYKDATKTQILQLATEKTNYDPYLRSRNQRIKLIAGNANVFEVVCPWRIRVGGHRGPESILLPAFDAQGIPYIPSSTLRGVARTQAIREVMANKNCHWADAEKDSLIVRHFGALDAEGADKAGKIVFLDAYPVADRCQVEIDMANNIWSWAGNDLNYSPNPNPFLSLKETTFLIGLRLISGETNQQLLQQVKNWLIAGLANGAGSQVNTGYGQLVTKALAKSDQEFLRVKFALEGQLIHGYQKPGQWQWNDRRNEWQARGSNQAEVRPTAFKSMLRYWFRVFALGVMAPKLAQDWEGKIFGAISPTQSHGYLRVNIIEGKVTQREARSSHQGRNDPCGEMEGMVTFSWSPEAPQNRGSAEKLVKNLAWLMFNLGGLGQGARRPCYSRKNSASQRAPWWRGSTFYLESDPWHDPENLSPKEYASLFKRRLRDFYTALGEVTQGQVMPERLQTCGMVNVSTWQEAADVNCCIVVARGEEDFGKPFALAQLHHQRFKVQGRNGLDYDGNLCGQVGGRGGVKPSPVWIADVGDDYQVVTIFGATAAPRQDYLQALRDAGAIQVFPLGGRG